MKVRVVFTLDIDDESYAIEYGLTREEVRKDVQRKAEAETRDHFETLGLLNDD